MIDLSAQRELSRTLTVLLSNIIRTHYHTSEEGFDIGSYARGTNTDDHPDIDLFFTKIPCLPDLGFVDWTPVDTLSITSSQDGIQDLGTIRQRDPILFQTITASIQQLQLLGFPTHFRGVKAWGGDPGVVFMLSIEHPQIGLLGIDVTLSYMKNHFSIEHVKSFNRALQNITTTYGPGHAQRVLADILRLKKVVKLASKRQGKLDRKKKIPGFVIEALFLYQPDPPSYDSLISLLAHHQWSDSEKMQLPEYIQEQEEQLIGTNKTLDDILHSLTRGGYETLKAVAAQENQPPSTGMI